MYLAQECYVWLHSKNKMSAMANFTISFLLVPPAYCYWSIVALVHKFSEQCVHYKTSIIRRHRVCQLS